MKLPEGMAYDKKTNTVTVTVTPKDCETFFTAQLLRAQRNLIGARERGDTRAEQNLLRKIEIYKLVIKWAREEKQ